MWTLWLTYARAAANYTCASCDVAIARGTMYYRHDPYALARLARGELTLHFCIRCVLSSKWLKRSRR